jgi:hypothetical protein
MSLFSKQSKLDTFGVLFDVGSGSVLTAIVHSSSKNTHPVIVWAHREHVPLRDIESLEQVSKSVKTAIINAAMELDTNGRKVLTQYDSSAKITQIQSSISAPWACTITKTIHYTQEKPFTVTQTLINELTQTTEKNIDHELASNESLDELGLHTITAVTMEMLSNGYRIASPKGSEASDFSIARANVVAQSHITSALKETVDKIYRDKEHRQLSFMLMAYSVMSELMPQIYEIGIIDVSYEATEMGIVRDGSLQYCTHTPFGSFSLARELTAALGVPLTEAFGYLHANEPLSFLDSLTEAKKAEVEKIFEAYVKKVETLFRETGDELSIPKSIAIHVDLKSEPLFSLLIERAAKRCIKSTPIVTLVTKEILKQTFNEKATKAFFTHSSDTALLLSAMFFHKHHNSTSFTFV